MWFVKPDPSNGLDSRKPGTKSDDMDNIGAYSLHMHIKIGPDLLYDLILLNNFLGIAPWKVCHVLIELWGPFKKELRPRPSGVIV